MDDANCKSWVYFVQAGNGPFKIGTTTNLKNRLKAFRTASPYPVRLLQAIEGDRETERYWHDFFAASRIQGEWFVASRAALGIIRELGKRGHPAALARAPEIVAEIERLSA